jgi:hypothetical protein
MMPCALKRCASEINLAAAQRLKRGSKKRNLAAAQRLKRGRS